MRHPMEVAHAGNRVPTLIETPRRRGEGTQAM
jgi:hypothetical protein